MADKFMSMKNLKFTLNDFIGQQKIEKYKTADKRFIKTSDMTLTAAFELAKDAMHPIFEDMDLNPPVLNNGVVEVHPDVRAILKTLGEDGWIAASFPEEFDGDNMPASLGHAVNFIFSTANYSANAYQSLTVGAARLIHTFGSDYLKNTYLPPMLDGKWQGTMALTEPDAGSSLADLITSAAPLDDGTYSITGEKIFISAGDHNGVDNVVHLMLARIENAPPGIKGISLFVVPKLRPDETGRLVNNDITVSQIFHKMGYKGTPITGLSLGEKNDCRGYLVGEPHKGLFYMFQMMNGERLDVGMGATGIATAAYHSALEYTKTRKQGRKFSDKKSIDQVPIIEHPDIKRMLLFQRSVSEGSLALILQCGLYEELSHTFTGPEKERFHLLLEILIPVAKTFPSEMGILSTSQSIQCFGGYGYCDDFPAQQHFRDMRIHPIHEGTTGIQGLDLLGRKIRMQEGKAFAILLNEIEGTIEAANPYQELAANAEDLSAAMKTICDTTGVLQKMASEKGDEAYLSNATLYLEMFGYFVVGWIWLAQAVVAKEKLLQKKVKKADVVFFTGKIKVQEYYFSNELPKINALAQVLTRRLPVTLSVDSDHFTN